jgi:hypothetical protein
LYERSVRVAASPGARSMPALLSDKP